MMSAAVENTYEVYSDEDSSQEAPPPPPPEYSEDERYQNQLKVFQGMAEFKDNVNQEDEDLMDQESVEVSLPPVERSTSGFRNRTPLFYYGCVVLAMMVGIILFLGIGLGTDAFKEEQPTPGPPVSSPTSDRDVTPTNGGDERAERVRSYLVSVAANGEDAFNDPISPESKALLWLQEEDPLVLDPLEFESHTRLDQRYALLSLWFQTDSNWNSEDNWLNEDECTWKGVTCETVSPDLRRNLQNDNPVVAGLDLEGNGLQGSIPNDIGLLQYLLTLNLSKNQLEGEIPQSMASLEFLEELYLDTNNLSGELQNVDFQFFTSLQTLDLSFNKLSGPIPDSVWSMHAMERLVLDDNSLTGSIPGKIGSAKSLGKPQ